jgi:hypothetical protein
MDYKLDPPVCNGQDCEDCPEYDDCVDPSPSHEDMCPGCMQCDWDYIKENAE